MTNQCLHFSRNIKIVIIGRNRDTINYEKALAALGIEALTTMDLGKLTEFNGLLLPGGGDITPAFFGQKNCGSRNIDVELDITQLQALDLFIKWKKPVLGICKGLQVINVYFGGTVIQDLLQADAHRYKDADQIHVTTALSDSIMEKLYGKNFLTNSAHHQGIGMLGHGLTVIQTAGDGVIEGALHNTLPIIGVQWHPERLFSSPSLEHTADGRLIFSYFLSLCRETGS